MVGPILTLQDQLCNARPTTVTTVIVPSPLLEKLSDRKKKSKLRTISFQAFFFTYTYFKVLDHFDLYSKKYSSHEWIFLSFFY